MTEPYATAAIIALFGALLAASTLLTRVLDRIGIPGALLFLVLGMIGGSEGLGGLQFHDAALAFRIGTVALVLILLDGGLNTNLQSIRTAAAPAGLLATLGVLLTAALVALLGGALGLRWEVAVLTGAIVSSTDAAAVFGILRGGGIRLEPKLQSTLEVESCANDPMAVILTLAATDAVASGQDPGWMTLLEIPLQVLVGIATGLACGFGFRFLLNSIRLSARGLYPVLVVASAFTAFGASTLVYGSGFLAVFVSSTVVGNGHVPFGPGLRRVLDSLAWLCQLSLFLMLGLLVFPSRLLPLSGTGIALGLILAFVARPLAAFVCLGLLRWPRPNTLVAGWVGLRGAVPIVLGTIPVMKGLEIGDQVFHLVFYVVVVSALIPGATIVPVVLRSKLGHRRPPLQGAELELNHRKRVTRELRTVTVSPGAPACGQTLRDIALPETLAIVLIIRNEEPLPARGSSQLLANDLLYVVGPPSAAEELAKWVNPPLDPLAPLSSGA